MAQAIVIRPAAIDERDALEELQRRASLVHDAYRQSLIDHPEAIDLPEEQIRGGCVWVAERDGRRLGFVVVLPRGDGQAELDGLFVEPDAWRQGAGRALVARVMAKARDDGASTLHVAAAPEALDFYRRCGFEQVGEEPTRFGPALLMRAQVPGPKSDWS